MSESQEQTSEKLKKLIRQILLEGKSGKSGVRSSVSNALHEWLARDDVQSARFVQPHRELLAADKKPD